MSIPPDVQQQILSDPRVKAKIQEVGEAALNDPAVQELVIKIAKEKGPEVGKAAAGKVREWAQDPVVQAQACAYAGVAAQYAARAGLAAAAYIEQGPTSARVLAFAGGVASIVCAGAHLISFADILLAPANYVLALYQTLFSLTTLLFELNPTVVAKFPAFSSYQDVLIEKAKFLSEARGRGLFYFFQGTVWLCFSSVWSLLSLQLFPALTFVCGVFMCLVGLVHVLIHYGKLQTVIEKGRDGYAKISDTP